MAVDFRLPVSTPHTHSTDIVGWQGPISPLTPGVGLQLGVAPLQPRICLWFPFIGSLVSQKASGPENWRRQVFGPFFQTALAALILSGALAGPFATPQGLAVLGVALILLVAGVCQAYSSGDGHRLVGLGAAWSALVILADFLTGGVAELWALNLVVFTTLRSGGVSARASAVVLGITAAWVVVSEADRAACWGALTEQRCGCIAPPARWPLWAAKLVRDVFMLGALGFLVEQLARERPRGELVSSAYLELAAHAVESLITHGGKPDFFAFGAPQCAPVIDPTEAARLWRQFEQLVLVAQRMIGARESFSPDGVWPADNNNGVAVRDRVGPPSFAENLSSASLTTVDNRPMRVPGMVDGKLVVHASPSLQELHHPVPLRPVPGIAPQLQPPPAKRGWHRKLHDRQAVAVLHLRVLDFERLHADAHSCVKLYRASVLALVESLQGTVYSSQTDCVTASWKAPSADEETAAVLACRCACRLREMGDGLLGSDGAPMATIRQVIVWEHVTYKSDDRGGGCSLASVIEKCDEMLRKMPEASSVLCTDLVYDRASHKIMMQRLSRSEVAQEFDGADLYEVLAEEDGGWQGLSQKSKATSFAKSDATGGATGATQDDSKRQGLTSAASPPGSPLSSNEGVHLAQPPPALRDFNSISQSTRSKSSRPSQASGAQEPKAGGADPSGCGAATPPVPPPPPCDAPMLSSPLSSNEAMPPAGAPPRPSLAGSTSQSSRPPVT